MKNRKFGSLGWQVSEVGFGAWAIGGDMWGPQDDNESLKALQKAIDLGCNFIDTAQGYGKGHSEEVIGKFLKDKKEEIFVATKIPPVEGTPWPPPYNYDANTSFPAEYLVKNVELALKRLQRDHIDVLQFHTWATSFNTKLEWYETLSKLKQEGKIRAIGVSVHDTTPDSVIGALALDKVDAVQVIYNIFEQYPEWNLFPVAERLNKAIIVRVPFDEGALTGKYKVDTVFPEGDVRRHYFRGPNLNTVVNKVKEVELLKHKYHPEMSMAEYALRFTLNHSAVSTVIPGIRNENQAVQNCSSSDGNLFTNEEKEELRKFNWQKDFWREEIEI